MKAKSAVKKLGGKKATDGAERVDRAAPTDADRVALQDAIELVKQARMITMALRTRKLIPRMKIGNPDYSLLDAIEQLGKMQQLWERPAAK